MVKCVRFCGDLREIDRSTGGISAILDNYEEVPNLKKLKDRKRDRKGSKKPIDPPKPSKVSFGVVVPQVDLFKK